MINYHISIVEEEDGMKVVALKFRDGELVGEIVKTISKEELFNRLKL